MLVRWTAAFSHALICHVRDDTDLNRELSTVLLPHEVSAATKAQPNATSFILQVTTHHLLTCQPRTLQLWWRGCAGGLGRTSAWWGAELACPCWASAATFRPTPPPPPPTPTPPLPPRPQVISELVDQCQLPDLKDERMFSSVRTMADAVGKCDVLLRYPVPLGGWPPQLGRLSAGCSDRVGGRRSWPAGSHVGCAAGRAVLPRHEPPSLPPPSSRLAAGYTRHTSRFLLMWLLALPFALWPQCSWASVPYTTGIAFLLLGIEDIGVQASVTGHGCAGKCHGALVCRQVSWGIGGTGVQVSSRRRSGVGGLGTLVLGLADTQAPSAGLKHRTAEPLCQGGRCQGWRVGAVRAVPDPPPPPRAWPHPAD